MVATISRIATPGAYLVDVVPACNAKTLQPSVSMHTHGIYSAVSPRMVPWHRIPSGCKEMPEAFDGVHSEAPPICQGANGTIFITFRLGLLHFILR